MKGNKMKFVRWLMGAFILGMILALIILRTPPILFHQNLPHIHFLGKALYIIILAGLMCLFRVLRGPTTADRIVAVDIFGFMLVGLCAILTIVTGRSWYIDIGIAWALQAFVTILALSKYLEGKGFDE
jgi:multicomponent Na+:H+ antiporter subunit F